MPGADSSRARLIIRPEAAFAEAPPANAATTLLRYTGDTINHSNATVISDEIRSDRQRTDAGLVGYEVAGDITQEVIFGTALGGFGSLLEAALCGTWTANVVKNGTTNRSFGIERGYLDLGKYFYFKGMTLDKLALDVTARQYVKFTSSWKGALSAPAASTSIAGSTTPTAASTNSQMRAGNLISILSAGSANTELVGVSAKSIKLAIGNGLRNHELATSLITDDFGRGPMEITGTVDTYFKDIVIYNQFLLNGFFAVAFTMTDPVLTAVANTFKFIIPNMKLTGAPTPVPSGDADVMQTLEFRAFIDNALGYSISVDRSVIV